MKLYEGMWKENMPNGKGKSFDENGKMMFEGDFVKGMIEGNGVEYYVNGGKKYEGEWKESLPNGKGRRYYENG